MQPENGESGNRVAANILSLSVVAMIVESSADDLLYTVAVSGPPQDFRGHENPASKIDFVSSFYPFRPQSLMSLTRNAIGFTFASEEQKALLNLAMTHSSCGVRNNSNLARGELSIATYPLDLLLYRLLEGWAVQIENEGLIESILTVFHRF